MRTKQVPRARFRARSLTARGMSCRARDVGVRIVRMLFTRQGSAAASSQTGPDSANGLPGAGLVWTK